MSAALSTVESRSCVNPTNGIVVLTHLIYSVYIRTLMRNVVSHCLIMYVAIQLGVVCTEGPFKVESHQKKLR